MADKTFTDITYNLVGQLEGRGKWLPALAVCLVFAFVGVLTNIIAFSTFIHTKGAFFDMGFFNIGTLLISINLIVCSLFIVVGGAQYMFFRGFRSKAQELEKLEDTIYQEVFKR